MHARQTSKKVKAALHTKFVNGAHYGAYPPIGYIKDPDQKGHLIPDTDYMWIVEKIFDLAAHGNGGAKIRRLLEEAEVPTPSWINYQRYGTFAHNIKKTECQLAESGERKNGDLTEKSKAVPLLAKPLQILDLFHFRKFHYGLKLISVDFNIENSSARRSHTLSD